MLSAAEKLAAKNSASESSEDLNQKMPAEDLNRKAEKSNMKKPAVEDPAKSNKRPKAQASTPKSA
jgi:hypothetical protein